MVYFLFLIFPYKQLRAIERFLSFNNIPILRFLDGNEVDLISLEVNSLLSSFQSQLFLKDKKHFIHMLVF